MLFYSPTYIQDNYRTVVGTCESCSQKRLNHFKLTIKRNTIVPFVETWLKLKTVLQSEVSWKEKVKQHLLMLICGIQKNGTQILLSACRIFVASWRIFYCSALGLSHWGTWALECMDLVIPRHVESFLGRGVPLEKGQATHSSVLGLSWWLRW